MNIPTLKQHLSKPKKAPKYKRMDYNKGDKFVSGLLSAIGDRSLSELSYSAGYCRNQVQRILSQKSSPRLHTFENILNECGYELKIVKRN